MIKEFIFKRKVIRFFKRLASLKAFGYCTYENRHFDDRYLIHITKSWQLDVIEELDAYEAFKGFKIRYPENSDEWIDLKMVFSLITHNKIIKLTDKSDSIHNAKMYFGKDGFEIHAYDDCDEIIRISMASFDKFQNRKCKSNKDTMTYKLSIKEQERQWMFNDVHCHCGGHTETIFVTNNIGMCTKMRCTGCREEVDITDVNCW